MEIRSAEQLMKTGLFHSKVEIISYLLLHFISEDPSPLGSWSLREKLLELDVNCSTASIGRYLKELDSQELTVQKSNLGRVITPVGLVKLSELDEKINRAFMQEKVGRVAKVTKYTELLDLLHVRCALESEAATLAAKNATENDLQLLFDSVNMHQSVVNENKDPTDAALEFHQTIAKISHNKLIRSILEMLIFEEKRIESTINNLVTRERGKIYVKEHIQIANAIRAKDEKLAAKLMRKHIDMLCVAIEEQEDNRNISM